MAMEMQTQSNYADTSYANASAFPMNTGANNGMYNPGYFQPNYAMPAYHQPQPSYPIYAQPMPGQPIYAQPALQTIALDPNLPVAAEEPGLAKVVL